MIASEDRKNRFPPSVIVDGIMMRSKPLLRRLRYIGLPVIELTESQRNALKIFRQKCDSGIYEFETATCICGTKDNEAILIASQDRYGIPVNTYLCPMCGILWTSPRMTVESLARFYESDYRPIYTGESTATEEFFNDQYRHGGGIYQFVAPYFKGLSESTVLDIGCGAGGALMAFAARGWRVAGCDLTKEYLKRGQEADLYLVHGDATRLRRFAPADLVIASHIFEHCPSPLSELNTWNTLLKQGGHLYIEMPGVLMAYESYGDFALFLQNAHLYHFTLKTLTWALAQTGFQLVKGDETIRALFIKTGRPSRCAPDRSEYIRILHYLKQREKMLVLLRQRQRSRMRASRLARKVIGNRAVGVIKRIWRGLRR